MTIFTKICGISTSHDAYVAQEAGAEYIGFIFFEKSPRNVSAKQAAEISKELSRSVIKVAVMVNPTDGEIQTMLEDFTPDYIQLHGKESIDRVDEIIVAFGIPVIKAVSVSSRNDIERGLRYSKVANMLLFDAKAPKGSDLPGGNGVSFDWRLLSGFSFDLPVFISGGIDVNNVSQAVMSSGIKMVDISSGVESSPGVKDDVKIRQLLGQVKRMEA